ncbi:MAG: S8 family serine peptidase [Deltaproteobacteria bacterium]|nr:S8 family serine peptidase [Deltaproteobacteria bacterium]
MNAARTALSLLCLLSVLACRNDLSENDSATKAITNRPQHEELFQLLLLKLRTPSLLETSKSVEGRINIDEQQKLSLLREQQSTIEYLESLSPDIKILFPYRFVLNGLSILVPSPLIEKVKAHNSVLEVHNGQPFLQPKLASSDKGTLGENTSVRFIGAEDVRTKLKIQSPNGETVPVDGRGIKVGIIDTGIDYTHKMFGGEGTEDVYKGNNPSLVEDGSFPTAKVAGGIDLVGTDYNEASRDFAAHIPRPDSDPLDEAGHGTHVAGTVAGVGDGKQTYTGVAPGADLYAIKVFGKDGSTSDAVVIAALEYAVDPNHDLDPEDRLDVVNLSLGSSFGLPYQLYDEAVSNLRNASITAAMSAGNSGNVPYIVGSPGASNEAISVAASVDNMDHNWKFRAVLFKLPEEEVTTKAVEAGISKPIEEAGDVKGKLVFIGHADGDLSPDQKEAVKGNIALIDRGLVSFSDKLQRAADAGAIGVVVANDREGEPLNMGGTGSFNFPAIMITQDLGKKVKEALATGAEVTIDFEIDQRIETPELIDQLTSFSSRGPRSIDSAIKPEITAPGQNIISAQMGGGDKGIALSGTSMSSPHMAGAAALMKQYRKGISEEALKDLFLSTSKTLTKKGVPYSVAYQGAGRLDVFRALTSPVSLSPSALSLGALEVTKKKMLRRNITIHNVSDEPLFLNIRAASSDGLAIEAPSSLFVNPHSSETVSLNITVTAPDTTWKEVSGFLDIQNDQGQPVGKVAMLAIVKPLSHVRLTELNVHASGPEDALGVVSEVTLKNNGPTKGHALLFNLFAEDEQQDPVGPAKRLTDICDLESSGYRIVEKTTKDGTEKHLQIAAKLFSPLTSWLHCELSVQIDGDGDGETDQELIGGSLSSLVPYASPLALVTVLTDADAMRRIRREYESGLGTANYAGAILGVDEMTTYAHGSLMVLSFPIAKLQKARFGLLRLKLASLVANDLVGGRDDFLATQKKQWHSVDPFETANPYYGMPEKVELKPFENVKLSLTHGENDGRLIAYFPFNKSSRTVVKDDQSQVAEEVWLYK